MGKQAEWQPGRVIMAALLTVLIPGVGHLVLRRWRSAAVWAAGFVLTLLVGWQVLEIETRGDLLDPSVLRRLLLVSGFLAVLRIASLVDVLWLADAFSHRVTITFSIAVILVALFPSVFIHTRTQTTIGALENVFVAPTIVASPVEILSEEVIEPEPEPEPERERVQPGTTIPGQQPPQLLEPPAETDSIAYYDQRLTVALGEDGRFTALLLGSDEAPGRSGIRTDSMIVASIDPWSLQVSLFSIPRNWRSMAMPSDWPGPNNHGGLSNTIYRYGWDHADELFPSATDPGAEALKRVFGDLLQLEIDAYWKVSMAGFVDVVDAFGGVTVNVQLPINNEFSHPENSGEFYDVKLSVGEQELTGLEALAYSRSRRTTSDYNRMGRQRCVVAAIGQQITATDLLFAFDDVVTAFEDHVSTDISISIVPALVDVSSLVELSNITTVAFVPPSFYSGGGPHVERVRQAVVDSLNREGDVGAEFIETVEGAC